jgi:hypothetical protein
VAPGSTWGITNPVVLGEERPTTLGPQEVMPAADWADMAQEPTLRQYLQSLDGQVFDTEDGPVTVSTLTDLDDGVTLKPVTFHKPGVIDRSSVSRFAGRLLSRRWLRS